MVALTDKCKQAQPALRSLQSSDSPDERAGSVQALNDHLAKIREFFSNHPCASSIKMGPFLDSLFADTSTLKLALEESTVDKVKQFIVEGGGLMKVQNTEYLNEGLLKMTMTNHFVQHVAQYYRILIQSELLHVQTPGSQNPLPLTVSLGLGLGHTWQVRLAAGFCSKTQL